MPDKRISFVGCSFTSGVGLLGGCQDENLWVNMLVHNLFNSYEVFNLGKGGANNHDIFLTTLDTISSISPQYLFVSWTELYRTCVNPGVETFATKSYWGENADLWPITVNPNITYPVSYLKNIRDRFFDLQHPHYEIVKILMYSKIIANLCQLTGTNVFFINSLLPWDQHFFKTVDLSSNSPTATTEYTQKILQLDTRNDCEYKKLYYKIHNDYKNLLSATHNKWLNLDRSFQKFFYIDLGLDNRHPGIESNRLFANFLIQQLTHKLT